jgi:N-acyl-D-aspartate/D-glutamate deacylase
MGQTLIKNALIVDGSGKSPFKGHVVLNDAFIERLIAEGDEAESMINKAAHFDAVIDADGRWLMPGFINMHSHSDCTVAMYPNMESALGQGITTEFAGHCGLGVAPVNRYWLYMFPEKKAFTKVIPDPIGGINPYVARYVPTEALRQPFYDTYGKVLDWSTYGEFISHIEREGVGTNFILVVGHSQLRLQSLGADYKRDATDEEIEEMAESLKEAMASGAVGISFGLDYEPSLYAGRAELLALMKVVATYDGIVTSHVRMRTHASYDQPQNAYEGYKEFLELGLEAGARIHISHIQNGYDITPADDALIGLGVQKTLEQIESYRQKGLAVTWDVIPKHIFGPFHYPMIMSMFQPYVEAAGGCEAFSEKLKIAYYREEIATEIREGNHISRGIFTRFNPKTTPDWDKKKAFTACEDQTWLGRTIRDVAGEKDSVDFLLELLIKEPYAMVMSTDRRPDHTPDREAFVAEEDASIALDTWAFDYDATLSEAHMPLECGSPATYTGMGTFMASQNEIPIETTIKKMTGNAATILGLKDRGFVKEGFRADLLIINPTTFSSNEQLADPRVGIKGLDYVFVNGVLAVKEEKHLHSRSGNVLKRRLDIKW